MELLLAERVTHDMAYLMLRDNLDVTSDPLTRLNLSLDRHFLCCVLVLQAHDKPQIEAHRSLSAKGCQNTKYILRWSKTMQDCPHVGQNC